jgi:hypothetical protein
MRTVNSNLSIIDGYMRLLSNLSPNNKLDLIAKLTAAVKTDLSDKPSRFKMAFGGFESSKTAEEIVEEIRSSRTFNRQIEPF